MSKPEMTRTEINAELKRMNIDMKPAYEKLDALLQLHGIGHEDEISSIIAEEIRKEIRKHLKKASLRDF